MSSRVSAIKHPSGFDSMAELFDRQPEVFGSFALIFMADVKFPGISWEYHTATSMLKVIFCHRYLLRKSAPPKPVV